MIKKTLHKIVKRLKRLLCSGNAPDMSEYRSVVNKRAPWVYIAYIPEALYLRNDLEFLNSHQNKKEAIVMVDVFNKLGYNVLVQGFDGKKKLPNLNVKIILGHPPAIELAAHKYTNAIVIQYATGCHYTHQNSQEKYITDSVNAKYNTFFHCERWVQPYNAHIISDRILLIGSKYTIETFPNTVHKKISTIHQSSQNVRTLEENQYAPQNHFFFMSSSGILLRGVSLLVEYFKKHQDKTIHLLCPIEPYLQSIISKLPSNIILHGTLPLGSNNMLDIMKMCNFIIYPSGSDGGTPGSVINSMKNGLIPIVSRWAAFDEIDQYGYMMRGWSTESVEQGITWSESLSPETIEQRKKSCAEYATKTYNIEKFSQEFEDYIRKVTSQYSILTKK